MKKDYISIIIPCYNVEKYIEKCLDAIINESFKNYEIILIDDCSSDNTLKIIKDYEKKYEFIKIIKNKKNSGAGFSRNQALKIAKYDIISFIDSDDIIDSNYHEELLKIMKKEKSDIAICDIYLKYEGDFREQDIRSIACYEEPTKYNFINNGLAASPCNKIFKKTLFDNNLFPEDIMNEDVAPIFTAMINAKKISYTNKTVYNYIQRKTSVQNKEVTMKRFDIFKAIYYLKERIEKNEETDKYMEAIIFNQIIVFLIYIIPKVENFNKRFKLLKEYHKRTKGLSIRKNKLYWHFLSTQPKLSRLFYKLLFKFTDMGFCFVANMLLVVLSIHKKKKEINVIKETISMEDIIECAKVQAAKVSTVNLSVVIPNYNYEKFMLQRLYSILNQTEKINEIIILDDCSTDKSRELIDKIYNNLKDIINIKKVYNKTNSGSAFKQWEKGFNMAEGDYVWIAEADDYCTNQFLRNVLTPIKNDSKVVLSYCDTAFIDKDGNIILKTIKPEIDIMKTGHWNKSYVNDGNKEIIDYSYLNCTIANVSSVIFKKQDYSDFFKMSGEYKQAGDWLFYVNVISRGKVAFCKKSLNFYRLHGNNVTSTTKKQAHFDEIKRIHKYLREKYGFTKEQEKEIEKRYEFLKKVWGL